MDIALDEVLHFDAVTHHPSTAAVTDADSTPTWSIFEEDTDTAILSAQNFTKRTSLTGNYRGSATLSTANGFEVGKWYNVIGSATVNSIAGKAVVMRFRVCAAEAVAGKPKVDVDALLGTAWLTPGTAGTPDVNVKLISSDATAADNAEAFFDGTGYAGTGNVIPTVTTTTTAINVTTVNGLAANVITAAATAADFTTEIQSGLATAANLATVAGYLDTEIADILADTNDIQTRLPAALVSGRIDASVGAMAANVMTAAAAAADLTTELQSGLATATALATAQTSIDDLPTNAELATALAAADDAVLAAVAALRVKKNTALAGFMFPMVDSTDHSTPETGATVTATRSLDGAAFGACANAVSEISNGLYKIDLAAGDLNGNVVTLKFSASGCDQRVITLVTQP